MNQIESQNEAKNSEGGFEPTKPVSKLRKMFKRSMCGAIWVALLLASAWCVGFAFSLSDNFPGWIAILAASFLAIGFPVLFWLNRKRLVVPILVTAVFVIAFCIYHALMPSSHDREWAQPNHRFRRQNFCPAKVDLTWLRSRIFEHCVLAPHRQAKVITMMIGMISQS